MKLLKPVNYILLGIPVIFLVGALFHFIYDLSGQSFLVGLFAPVNESVFEHMKMALLPTIMWWLVYYIFNRKTINRNKWLTGALVALTVTLISIPLLFYFYTGAFGKDIVAVDILLFFISICLGQLAGLHYYKHGDGINGYTALAVIILIVIVFALLTVFPPQIPLFMDSTDGTYGIKI